MPRGKMRLGGFSGGQVRARVGSVDLTKRVPVRVTGERLDVAGGASELMHLVISRAMVELGVRDCAQLVVRPGLPAV